MSVPALAPLRRRWAGLDEILDRAADEVEAYVVAHVPGRQGQDGDRARLFELARYLKGEEPR